MPFDKPVLEEKGEAVQKHILGASDWTREDILDFLDHAEAMKPYAAREKLFSAPFEEKVTLLFAEPSSRTCDSYHEAAQLIGCRTKPIVGLEASSIFKGEPLSRNVVTEAGYNADVLVLRTKIEGGARWVAEMLEAYHHHTAVHNAGDGSNQHPTQALTDLLTIRRYYPKLGGFRFGIVGDLKNSRTVHPLLEAFRLLGSDVDIVLVSAPEVRLQPWYTYGMRVHEHDRLEALEGCDFVYVTRVQHERFASELDYQRVRGRYVVNRKVLSMLPNTCRIMHPQPIADGEIAPEIWRHPQVIVDEQARNGVPVRMVLLVDSIGQLGSSGFPESPPPVIQTTRDESTEEVLERKKNSKLHVTPVDNGMIVDHLQHRFSDKLVPMLEAVIGPLDNIVIPARGLDTKHPLPGGKKDRLSLEGCFLPDDIIAAISLMAPTATFNRVENGRVKWLKVQSVSAINNLGRCPNPMCVTRLDVEAANFPKFHVVQHGCTFLRCHYCDQHFGTNEVFI